MTTPHWTTIDAYLAGQATAEEQSAVANWLAEDPSRQHVLDALKRGAPGEIRDYDVNAAWQRFQSTVHGAPERRIEASPARRVPWLRIAAAMLVVAGGGALWQSTRSAAGVAADTQRVASITVATGSGERKDITLADGSTITLNAGSSVTYDSTRAGSREVTLDGEAYFDVRHDAARPFRVHARGGVAEDVGTRFIVRAYGDAQHVEVAVAEGAVRFSRAGSDTSSRLLTAGMLGVLSATGAPTAATLASSERYFGWTKGVLALEGRTLRDAIPDLERRYGITIEVRDSALAAKRVFARFTTETAGQAIDAIALALDAMASRNGNRVTLRNRSGK